MTFLYLLYSFYNFNAFERVLKGNIKHSFLEIFFLSNNLFKTYHFLGKTDRSFSKKVSTKYNNSLILLIDLFIDFLDNKLTEA